MLCSPRGSLKIDQIVIIVYAIRNVPVVYLMAASFKPIKPCGSNYTRYTLDSLLFSHAINKLQSMTSHNKKAIVLV